MGLRNTQRNFNSVGFKANAGQKRVQTVLNEDITDDLMNPLEYGDTSTGGRQRTKH
jgi:hypothetical protein